MNSFSRIVLILVFTFNVVSIVVAQEPGKDAAYTGEDLLTAAQKQEVEKVKSILASGVDVNSRSKYGATALYFAADRGDAELAKVLLEAGADPNLKDQFYNGTPMMFAAMRKHYDVISCLYRYGASNPDLALFSAIATNDSDMATAVLASGKVEGQSLAKAKEIAAKKEPEIWKEMFADLEVPELEPFEIDSEDFERLVGKYSAFSMVANVTIDQSDLKLGFGSAGGTILQPMSQNKFLMGQSMLAFSDDSPASALTMSMAGSTFTLDRISEEEAAKLAKANEEESDKEFDSDAQTSLAADLEVSSSDWPMFRGNGSRGVAQGQNPPIEWDVEENKKVQWKIATEGLGLSCPTIWQDRIYLTSAVSDADAGEFRTGLYGDVDSVQDDSTYDFNVYCYNKSNGELVWKKTATQAKPAVKRHAKSSHANPTVAVNGQYIVAFFASEGLYCYSMAGELIWKKDLGFLDSGWFYDADYQWGFASSPIIFEDNVIVQCDIQGDSFVASYSLKDGNEVWKTQRDEIPSWSSPIVHLFGDLPMLITYGTGGAKGYDARDGQLLWELKGRHSEIVVPTPFVAHDLIYICSGYSPIQPVYAIKPSARGEITLTDDQESSEHVAWSKQRGGPYLPTPVVYGDFLYICDNSGILTCLKATTGEQVYRKRMRANGGSLSFSASLLAADGHVYCFAEDGRTLVLKAGPKYELVATNSAGENVLATPAISDGVLYLRTQNSLIAVKGDQADVEGATEEKPVDENVDQ